MVGCLLNFVVFAGLLGLQVWCVFGLVGTCGLCVCRRCFLGGLFVCCCFGGFGGYGCGLVAWMWFEFGCVCSVVLRVGCLVLFGFRCLMGVMVWFYGCYWFVRVAVVTDGGCCDLVFLRL